MGRERMSDDVSGQSPEYIARWSLLPLCAVYLRRVRPAGTPAAVWPATVAYATAEQCKSCYNRQYGKPMSVAASLKATSGRGVKVTKSRVRGKLVESTKVSLCPGRRSPLTGPPRSVRPRCASQRWSCTALRRSSAKPARPQISSRCSVCSTSIRRWASVSRTILAGRISTETLFRKCRSSRNPLQIVRY